MSLVAALLLDCALGFIAQRLLRSSSVKVPCVANDNEEPLVDFDRVHADLERIEELLASGRVAEAHDECCRLLDVMEGIDEAAATDARWWAERGRTAA